MQDVLLLGYEGKTLREFTLGDRPLDVGRSRHCAIVVHDPELAERAFLIERTPDGVRAVDLVRGQSRSLGVGASLSLGRHHQLRRVRSEHPPAPSPSRTEPMTTMVAPARPLAVVIGSGSETRHVRLDGRPITLGSDGRRNDVVLVDRAVSGSHCRLEPLDGRVLVRDLDSRNGTWISGRRVHAVEVGPGATVRIGRTDLRIVAPEPEHSPLVVESEPMRGVMDEVRRVARVPRYCVLVTGESGAGKEGVARSLHRLGPRADGPFVAYNGAGFSEQLVASQLFGHERGAFTGAESAHRGAFEQAEGGTLFLDEVGELPLTTQARLLRVLETWEIRRLGSEQVRKVDLRLVTATNRDLRREVAAGRFREDLHYRLMQFLIVVPPLRDRVADIAPLARRFLGEVALDLGAPKVLTADALERLERHDFRGNVRELRNLVIQAAVWAATDRVTRADVVRAIERTSGVVRMEDHASSSIVRAVERHQGNLSAAARALGIPRSTLRDRLKRAGQE